MRDILIILAPYLVWILAITELGLEIFAVLKARKIPGYYGIFLWI